MFHTMIAAAARLAGSLGRPGGVDECLFGRLFASRYRKPRGSRIWGGFKPILVGDVMLAVLG